MTRQDIEIYLKALDVFQRYPNSRMFTEICALLFSEMKRARLKELAGMVCFSTLLKMEGHPIKIWTCSRSDMKQTRVTAAKTIFN